jgi:hypothetical protein
VTKSEAYRAAVAAEAMPPAAYPPDVEPEVVLPPATFPAEAHAGWGEGVGKGVGMHMAAGVCGDKCKSESGDGGVGNGEPWAKEQETHIKPPLVIARNKDREPSWLLKDEAKCGGAVTGVTVREFGGNIGADLRKFVIPRVNLAQEADEKPTNSGLWLNPAASQVIRDNFDGIYQAFDQLVASKEAVTR